MKRIWIVAAVLLLLPACSPALSREVMRQGVRDVPFSLLRDAPESHKGKVFILGGLIVETRLTGKGSQIEAVSVPVDSRGYLKEDEQGEGRYLALFPSSKGLLDPFVFRKGREITLAGEFLETRKGRIDEMEYIYPVFEIREITLWEERKYYYSPYYYYDYPFLFDPWGENRR